MWGEAKESVQILVGLGVLRARLVGGFRRVQLLLMITTNYFLLVRLFMLENLFSLPTIRMDEHLLNLQLIRC